MMMRGMVAAACALAGCASGRNSIDPPDAGGNAGPDAKVWRDGAIEPQPDAPHVNPPTPDASVDAAPVPMCADQQLLTNPVLDLNPSGMGWVQENIDDFAPIITGDDGIVEDSPPFKAWMGGLEAYDYGVNTVTDTLYQDVAIPAGTTKVRITGKFEVRTAETSGLPYDTGQIAVTQTNGTPIVVLQDMTNLTPTTSWTAIDHTLAQPMAGQTIRLRMTTSNDIIDPTSFYFDTLAVTATVCQ